MDWNGGLLGERVGCGRRGRLRTRPFPGSIASPAVGEQSEQGVWRRGLRSVGPAAQILPLGILGALPSVAVEGVCQLRGWGGAKRRGLG